MQLQSPSVLADPGNSPLNLPKFRAVVACHGTIFSIPKPKAQEHVLILDLQPLKPLIPNLGT